MINIGVINRLKVVRKADFGFYLDAGTERTSDDILLPNKSALDVELEIGDEVDAFIYRDSKDRIIATLKEPLAKVGEVAALKVVAKSKIGSFVDIGLERDVLVPFKEQKYNMEVGESYPVYLYVDKSGRMAATTDVEKHLQTTDKYTLGQEVPGVVYGFQTNGSAMVAVEGKYTGVILENEYFTQLRKGQFLDLRVKKYYEDGKIGLTPRQGKLYERDKLEETIYKYLKNHDGFMPFNDKTPPEKIKAEFGTSKNYFKIALGGLMRHDVIVQDEEGTRLK